MANNVRFVKTTKEKYLKRDTYDPNALYFCDDTQEIYKGDKPYTEGIKIVPTKDDLPEYSCAADGVVYFIAETKSGYMLSPDRTEWLQTIYAPITDAYVIPEDEMYTTVTTVGAVRDIEKKIYEKIEEITSVPTSNVEKSDTNGNIKIDGVETVVYTHPEKHKIEDVEGLQDALDGKQASGGFADEDHQHTKDQITDFEHNHIVDDITDLDTVIKTEIDTAIKVESDRAKGAETDLQEQITANVKAIELLTNGVSADDIDSVNDLINYVKSHGAEVTGIKEDIAANVKSIEDHEAFAAKTYETKDDAAQKLTDAKSYTDKKVAAISFPQSDWEQTDETQHDYIKNKPTVLTEDEVIQLIKDNGGGGGTGGYSAEYVEYISDDSTPEIEVEIANNTIISVQGYESVKITKPSRLDNIPIWECYFYVHFNDSKNVSLELPDGMRRNGDDPSYVKPNDVWEVSINKQGGAVCLRN